MDELVLDDEDALEQLWNHDFEPAWNKFLAGYKETPIRTLAELAKFNDQHADLALPSGALDNKLSDAKYAEGVRILRQASRIKGIDKTLSDSHPDVVIGPMDGRIPTIAAAAGYPVGTMPLGYSKTNGRAFAACIVASGWRGQDPPCNARLARHYASAEAPSPTRQRRPASTWGFRLVFDGMVLDDLV